MGIEPTASDLEGRRSTAELHPHFLTSLQRNQQKKYLLSAPHLLEPGGNSRPSELAVLIP